jgi:integrase
MDVMSVHRLGKNLYQVRVGLPRQPDGSRSSVTQTVHGTETEAKCVEPELLHQRERDKLVIRARGEFAAYCDEWYEAALRDTRPEPKTADHWAYVIDTHIVPRLGRMRISDITPAVVRRFYGEIRADRQLAGGSVRKGLSGTSARKVAVRLSAILDQATVDGLITWNPCRAVKAPSVDTPEKEMLTADDVHALLEAFADTLRGRAVRDVAVFLLGTGVRPGEALALHWSAVDCAKQTAWIHQSLEKVGKQAARLKDVKTKRGQRAVPLPPDVVVMLGEHLAEQRAFRLQIGRWQDEDLVFPSLDRRKNPGGPWTVQAFRQAWNRELAGTPFADKSPYVCRHSYATLLRGLIPDEELSRILGHSSSNVLRATYSHVNKESMTRVRELIGALLQLRCRERRR